MVCRETSAEGQREENPESRTARRLGVEQSSQSHRLGRRFGPSDRLARSDERREIERFGQHPDRIFGPGGHVAKLAPAVIADVMQLRDRNRDLAPAHRERNRGSGIRSSGIAGESGDSKCAQRFQHRASPELRAKAAIAGAPIAAVICQNIAMRAKRPLSFKSIRD